MEVNNIVLGKMEEKLKEYPDDFFDSMVTDPPYGFGKEPNIVQVMKDWVEKGYHEVESKSGGFMGKKWDSFVPQPIQFKQTFRVLKPGAYALVSCGTRTQDWMAASLRFAGFEIRDVITWHYGQGFPKSLNVNKQLENEICNCEKEIPGKQEAEYDLRPVRESNISKEVNIGKTGGEILQPGLSEQSTHESVLREESKEINANGKESRLEGRRNYVQEKGELQGCEIHKSNRVDITNGKEGWVHNGTQGGNGENVQEITNKDGSSSPQRSQPKQQSTTEFTPISNQCNSQVNGIWENCSRCGKPILPDGIGTALKPATEFWTLCRKPISENTVAENVLKHGTGGINIDGSRIGNEEIKTQGGDKFKGDGIYNKYNNCEGSSHTGRFPSNLILDDFMAAELDKQSGVLKSGHMDTFSQGKNYGIYGKYNGKEVYAEGDSGGASRFFKVVNMEEQSRFIYQAKPSQEERNKGLKGIEAIKVNDGRKTEIDNPYQRGETMWKNFHPTVKPIELMRYFVKMITRKGGVCVDPFCGSGSTLIACKMEEINYVGIDTEPEYCEISEARIKAWYLQTDLFNE